MNSNMCTSRSTENGSGFLNQVRASHRPARGWFLKTDPVWIVGMRACVCPRPRLLITSGVMWRDMDLIRLVKQVLTAVIWQL